MHAEYALQSVLRYVWDHGCQFTNSATRLRASTMSSNALSWSLGRYFSLRNKDSEYGLSLLTLDRLGECATPRRCSVAGIVSPFIDDPMSE